METNPRVLSLQQDSVETQVTSASDMWIDFTLYVGNDFSFHCYVFYLIS